MSLSETTVSTKSLFADSGRLSKTAGYYAAFVALGLAEAALGTTLPGLAEQTQTGLREISVLFVARSLGYLLGALLGGHLYDRMPGHPVMAAVLVGITLSLALIPVMPALWLLSLVLLLLGVAQSTLDVGGNTLLVWVHRREVGPFMNGLHFFFGVGAFLSPIVVARAILLSGGISWAYWILALLTAPAALWLLRLPSPVSPHTTTDAPTGRTNYLMVVLVSLFFFLFVGAEISFGGWIFSYAVALNLTGEASAAYLTAGFWGALTVSRLLAVPIAARFRPRNILLADLLVCMASIALILLRSDSLLVTWVGALGAGASLASVFPTALAWAERHLPVTGRVTGWFIVGGSAGSMTLPWLIGQLFESVGPRVMMLAIFGDLLLAVGLFVGLVVYSARLLPAGPRQPVAG